MFHTGSPNSVSYSYFSSTNPLESEGELFAPTSHFVLCRLVRILPAHQTDQSLFSPCRELLYLALYNNGYGCALLALDRLLLPRHASVPDCPFAPVFVLLPIFIFALLENFLNRYPTKQVGSCVYVDTKAHLSHPLLLTCTSSRQSR